MAATSESKPAASGQPSPRTKQQESNKSARSIRFFIGTVIEPHTSHIGEAENGYT